MQEKLHNSVKLWITGIILYTRTPAILSVIFFVVRHKKLSRYFTYEDSSDASVILNYRPTVPIISVLETF